MTEIVKTCCETQEMVVIKYDEENEDLFLYGYIKRYDDKALIVECINERGQYDGYAVLPISAIWRLSYGGKKLERIRLLDEDTGHVSMDMEYKSDRLSHDMLEFAKANGLIVTLFTEDTEIEGYVKEYDDHNVQIIKIDEFGAEEGYTATSLDKVLYLFTDTKEGRIRNILHKEAYKQGLWDNKKHKSTVKQCEHNNKHSNENILLNTVEHCYQNNLVASIFDVDSEQSEDGNWVGIIDSYSKKEIVFRHISVDGEYDGYVWKKMDAICGIAYGGRYEKKIEFLYQYMNPRYHNLKKGKKTLLTSLLKYAKKNTYVISMDTLSGAWTGFVEEYDKNVVKLKVMDRDAQEDGTIAVKLDDIDTVRCNGVEEREITKLTG